MMAFTREQAVAGQAVYTKRVLHVYDLLVLGFSNRFVWKCPTPALLAHYDVHVTANHLDVGVGTGYFLDRCHFPSATPRVALMDLNANSLEFAARRIARYRPEAYLRDVLVAAGLDAPGFDSIALSYLIHCLPGSMRSKAVIFDHLGRLMNPGATLFGATLLRSARAPGPLGRRLMALYNARGIFSNNADTLDALEYELVQRFSDVSLQLVGCAALFAARNRK